MMKTRDLGFLFSFIDCAYLRTLAYPRIMFCCFFFVFLKLPQMAYGILVSDQDGTWVQVKAYES